MTPNEALNNIALYSSTHNRVIDESIKVIAKPLYLIDKLKPYIADIDNKNCDEGFYFIVIKQNEITKTLLEELKEVLWKD